jgi:aspartyl-tRNA(Asn)/glutamyl-tRNA(Gln) amidotransferase subunit B
VESFPSCRGELPELPAARIGRIAEEVGFETAEALVTSGRDRLFDEVGGDRREVANVLMNQFAGTGVDPAAVDAAELSKLIEARDQVPRPVFLQALARSGDPGFSAEAYLGDGQITEAGDLEPLVDRVLAANPDQVESYRSGKEGLLGFFVGQVMKETEGRANPKLVNELLREKLKA